MPGDMDPSTSPDSSISISSLLASCSLSSPRVSTRSVGPIQYRDVLYDSASKALEAYIADHEESLHSPAAGTGKITVRPSTHHVSAKRKDGRPGHKRSSSRRRPAPRDPDLLSLTTDDLLCFPSDGSLSFSRASEDRFWKSFDNHHHPALPSPLTSSNGGRASHSHSLRFADLPRPKAPAGGTLRKTWRLPDRENNPALHQDLPGGSSFCKRYPRWLTSQKSDLGVSGITSIPDVKYPLWLRDHGLLDGSEGSIEHTKSHKTFNRFYGPWQTPFYRSSGDQPGHRRVNSGTDGNPHPPTGRNYPDYSPAERPEHTYNLPEDSHPHPPLHNGSPRTEEVLEAERSWEKIPYSFKSPVPVLDEGNTGRLQSSLVEEFLNDCVKQESKVHSFSGGNHHGPVEALKHMLFNLQTFQLDITKDMAPGKPGQCQEISTDTKTDMKMGDQERFPVNKSLEKALHHLSRLKELVGDKDVKPD